MTFKVADERRDTFHDVTSLSLCPTQWSFRAYIRTHSEWSGKHARGDVCQPWARGEATPLDQYAVTKATRVSKYTQLQLHNAGIFFYWFNIRWARWESEGFGSKFLWNGGAHYHTTRRCTLPHHTASHFRRHHSAKSTSCWRHTSLHSTHLLFPYSLQFYPLSTQHPRPPVITCISSPLSPLSSSPPPPLQGSQILPVHRLFSPPLYSLS